MTAEVTEGQLQGREPTRQGKGDQKRETRQDRQQERGQRDEQEGTQLQLNPVSDVLGCPDE